MQSAPVRLLIGLGYATRSKRLRTTDLESDENNKKCHLMLKLYCYLVNYKLQSVANIFKTVDTMQKLTSKSTSATPKT